MSKQKPLILRDNDKIIVVENALVPAFVPHVYIATPRKSDGRLLLRTVKEITHIPRFEKSDAIIDSEQLAAAINAKLIEDASSHCFYRHHLPCWRQKEWLAAEVIGDGVWPGSVMDD